MLVSTLKATEKEQTLSDQTYTQANLLAEFPLTTARDRRWWSHWRSLGSPNIPTNFFARPLFVSGGLAIHTSGLNYNWLKVVIALEVMVFWHFVAAKPACLAVPL